MILEVADFASAPRHRARGWPGRSQSADQF